MTTRKSLYSEIFKVFCFHMKTKPNAFKFLWFEESFEKLHFSDSVDVSANNRNEAVFSNFSIVWMITDEKKLEG